MNEYYASMSFEDIPDKEMRVLAKALGHKAAAGGQLSTSTIEPVAAQGRLMQTMAGQRARDIGVQEARKAGDKVDRQAVLARALAANNKRDFAIPSNTATERFEKDASTISTVENLLGRWDDKYAGAIPFSGKLEEWAGRKGIGSPEMQRMGEWWSDWKLYYENIIRHDLFGSALTDSEKKEWEKANINSDMSPELIRSKMATLRRLNRKAAAYHAKNAINKDWRPDYVHGVYEHILPGEAWDDLSGYMAVQSKSASLSDLQRNKVRDLSTEEIYRILEGIE